MTNSRIKRIKQNIPGHISKDIGKVILFNSLGSDTIEIYNENQNENKHRLSILSSIKAKMLINCLKVPGIFAIMTILFVDLDYGYMESKFGVNRLDDIRMSGWLYSIKRKKLEGLINNITSYDILASSIYMTFNVCLTGLIDKNSNE